VVLGSNGLDGVNTPMESVTDTDPVTGAELLTVKVEGVTVEAWRRSEKAARTVVAPWTPVAPTPGATDTTKVPSCRRAELAPGV
jgi:hypothetical protein